MQTVIDKQCRDCDKWIIHGTPFQGACAHSDDGVHHWRKAHREIAAPQRRTTESTEGMRCSACGGSRGIFCPMSADGEGPHSYR